MYARDEDMPGPMLAEMRPLLYELCRAGVMHWLDGRFNALWSIHKLLRFPFLLANPQHPQLARCIRAALADSHFRHFAGDHGELAALGEELFPEPLVDPRGRAAEPLAPRCDTPVALFLFNRPETTARVLDSIRLVRPSQLHLIADGPRPGVAGDGDRCAAARAVAEAVDWPCQIVRDYASTNLGLTTRVETGQSPLRAGGGGHRPRGRLCAAPDVLSFLQRAPRALSPRAARLEHRRQRLPLRASLSCCTGASTIGI